MDHHTLIAQHEAIDTATQLLLALIQDDTPRHAEASRSLSRLAELVRDHLAAEDPVIYETVAAARATRHGAVAALSATEFDRLRRDWTEYLYRWDRATVVAEWHRFVEDSRSMLKRLRERVTRETAILYSLAEHYGVIPGKDDSGA